MKSLLKKIFLMIVTFGICMINASASLDDCNEAMDKYSKVFEIISSCNAYYHESAVFDVTQEKNTDLSDLAKKCETSYIGVYYAMAKERVNYNEYLKAIDKEVNFCDSNLQNCNEYELSASINTKSIEFYFNIMFKDDFGSIQQYAREEFEKVAQICDADYVNNGTSGTHYRNIYSSKHDEIYEGFSNPCSWIRRNKGIQYYVQIVLRIVSFVALGLAVVLGSIDFIKAIVSQDDVALKKAFQSFMKRLVAVVVIFLVQYFVQLFMGLITAIPNYNANQLSICEEFNIGK